MRNTVYSSFPWSQLSSFGIGIGIGNNNEVVHQIPTSDFSVCGSSLINGGSSSTSTTFFRDSQVCNDEHLGSFAPLSSIDIPPSSSSLNYLHLPTPAPGSLTSTITTTTATNFMSEPTFQPNFTQMRRLVNQFVKARPFESDIKHKIKADISRIDRAPTVEESRKRKAICVDDHQRPRPIQEHPPLETQRLPVKRSQKITDRITALQKLVSPFGKTDTASVLQEASVYIKLLHEQIQMLSTPYFAAGSLIQQGVGGGRSLDLRSRGLCLVPVSFTRNIIRQETQDTVDSSISRRTKIPRNY